MTKENTYLLDGIEASAKFYGANAETVLDLIDWIRKLDNDRARLRMLLSKERKAHEDIIKALEDVDQTFRSWIDIVNRTDADNDGEY